MFRRAFAAAFFAAAFLPHVATDGANAFGKVVPALAVIAQVDARGKVVGFGTGFCVGSNDQHSDFATNHHVIAAPAGGPTTLVAILTADPQARHPARIVADSTDPDIAVIEIDVPNVPALTLSRTMPDTGDDVAIAGFPWNEGQLWGSLLGGAGFRLGVGQHQFPPELQPSYHSGPVSAIHGGGQYYIQYDAITDHGNSGGPLFDPSNGTVYGIVQATVPGMNDPLADTPPSVYNNLAISVREGWSVLAKAPALTAAATVDRAGYTGGGGDNLFAAQSAARTANASPACLAEASALGRAYGEWSQAHGSLKSLEAFVAAPPSAATRAMLARISPADVARRGIAAEAEAIAALAQSGRRIREADPVQGAQLAAPLLAAVQTASARDRKIAAQLEAWPPLSGQPYVRPPGLGTDRAAEKPLGAAADRVYSLLDCT
jgi:hypothetical protein